MSVRTFCDKCNQELVIPDEKIDFVTGQPTSGPGDICWQCRLKDMAEIYNEKTKDMNDRPKAVLRWSPPTQEVEWVDSYPGPLKVRFTNAKP